MIINVMRNAVVGNTVFVEIAMITARTIFNIDEYNSSIPYAYTSSSSFLTTCFSTKKYAVLFASLAIIANHLTKSIAYFMSIFQ
jgi:hypothetical protein